MSCKTPLKGFILKHKKLSNDKKYEIKITQYKVHHLELIHKKIVVAYDDWSSPNATAIYTDYIEIPCGKCLACQLDYARDWASRCILEAQMHDSSCFITLTYDDEHVKLATNDDGDLTMTLIKKDMQTFLKDLRAYLDYHTRKSVKIRFFGCGEYGSKSKRPHYHLIVFGWMPDDLVFYKFSHDHRPMYNSVTLDKIWKKGFSVVGDVTFESAGYVARYVTKKMKNDNSSVYEQYNIEPEFVLMSRMRGIGYPWYESCFKPEMFADPYIHIASDKGGRKILIPRYIFKCAAEQYPDLYERFLEQRAVSAIVSAAVKDSLTELPRDEMLRRDLEVLEAKAQSLVRLL